MADDRNLIVHVYNDELAIMLQQRLAGHVALLEHWLAVIKTAAIG